MLRSLRSAAWLPWALACGAVVVALALGAVSLGRGMAIHALEGTVAEQDVTAEHYRNVASRARTMADSMAKLVALASAHAEEVSRPLRGNGAYGNRVIVRRVIEHDTLVRVDTLTPELPPADTGVLTEEQAARALPIVRHSLDSLNAAVQVNAVTVQMERSASLLVEQSLSGQLAHERSLGVRLKRAVKWFGAGVVTGGGVVLLLL